jgi:uncharacterized OB-fold protein
MSEVTRVALPVPVTDDDTREFWEGCRKERLMVQRCRDCGHYRYPPRPMCPQCGGLDMNWVQVTGAGTVYSWLVVYHPVHPAVRDKIPYNLVLIELDEGPRIVSNLVGVAPGEIEPGRRVTVVFDHSSTDVSLPKFRYV